MPSGFSHNSTAWINNPFISSVIAVLSVPSRARTQIISYALVATKILFLRPRVFQAECLAGGDLPVSMCRGGSVRRNCWIV